MTPPAYEPSAHQQGVSPTLSAANLPLIQEETASPEVNRLFTKFRQDFGRPHVPGILRCFATHPPLLEHIMALAKELLFVDGALGRQNKELIAAFVSSVNGCDYCADSHACSFREQGGTPDTTKAVLACDLDSSALSPQQSTLLHFAGKITENSRAVAPEDIETMRAAGWSNLQLAEAIHITSLFAAFNRVVNAFGLPSQHLLRTFEQQEDHGR